MNYAANDSPDQKWPNRLVIVRHGQSQRNEAKDLAKQSGHSSFGSGLRDVDTPLTEKGARQAELTGQALRRLYEFDVAFTSPYERTRCTTNFLLRAFEPKPKVVVEERIREIEFGILDGLTSEGIVEQYPKEFLGRKIYV